MIIFACLLLLTVGSSKEEIMERIETQVFESEEFRIRPWYQGCASEMVIPPSSGGSPDFYALQAMENSGEYVAEPKGDGNWASIFKSDDRVWHHSRTCKDKGIRDPEHYLNLPDGTLLVGEVMRGSQFALKMQAHYGYEFFLVWDILYADYYPIRELPFVERRKILETTLEAHDTNGRVRVMPQFSKDFVKEYEGQHEGLVLKRKDDGAYVGNGTKVGSWYKAKKWFESDAIILGYNLSTCRGHQAGMDLPANVLVGLYGLKTEKECRQSFNSCKGQKYVGCDYDSLGIPKEIQSNGQTLRLFVASAVNCGDYELGLRLVKEWADCQYKVMKVKHFGGFDSGSFRHPNPMDGVLSVRDDKKPEDCVFTGVTYKLM